MRNSILRSLLLVGLVLGLTACSSDDSKDTQKPVIILNAPKEGAKLEVGTTLYFDMEVSDNEMLGSYKIDIHENSNGHTHSAKKAASMEEEIEFSFQRSWALEGVKNININHSEIAVPANAELGKYHFTVYVLDAAGNQSMETRNIELVVQEAGDIN